MATALLLPLAPLAGLIIGLLLALRTITAERAEARRAAERREGFRLYMAAKRAHAEKWIPIYAAKAAAADATGAYHTAAHYRHEARHLARYLHA